MDFKFTTVRRVASNLVGRLQKANQQASDMNERLERAKARYADKTEPFRYGN